MLCGATVIASAAHVLFGREGIRDSDPSAATVPSLPSETVAALDAEPAYDYPFEPQVPGRAPAAELPGWTLVTIAPGDNLSIVFSRHELDRTDLHSILESGEEAAGLKRLMPGQQVRFRRDGSRVLELVHEEDALRTLHVSRDGDRFVARIVVIEPEHRVANAVGTIDSSLFLAGQEAGLTDAMLLDLAEIFGWDIDFVLDIRQGDRFSVIYEEYLKDGRKVRDGAILAAEFVNDGAVYRAVRYVDGQGRASYYSKDGKAMRKAFLRTPVNFTRISSHFNLNRRHPILNTIRAHRGVDYAAPQGTPVKATGDGRVVSVGSGAGYGNMIVLQHGGSYSTVYAHLSRFSRGLRRGNNVRQGQTIGYVGMTGLATGPHLHYEFRVNGVHANPLTVKLPKTLPIAEQYRADFLAKAEPLLAELDRLATVAPGSGRSFVSAGR